MSGASPKPRGLKRGKRVLRQETGCCGWRGEEDADLRVGPVPQLETPAAPVSAGWSPSGGQGLPDSGIPELWDRVQNRRPLLGPGTFWNFWGRKWRVSQRPRPWPGHRPGRWRWGSRAGPPLRGLAKENTPDRLECARDARDDSLFTQVWGPSPTAGFPFLPLSRFSPRLLTDGGVGLRLESRPTAGGRSGARVPSPAPGGPAPLPPPGVRSPRSRASKPPSPSKKPTTSLPRPQEGTGTRGEQDFPAGPAASKERGGGGDCFLDTYCVPA